ncbi:MAG TPA: pilus assembly protein TadG-related protein [Caulobacteraceae bacterium]|jgi:Flp pilus assembly protein TadG|nr:pilus assembly protein TadG-related protein [Caulobacteraceae bacterium]
MSGDNLMGPTLPAEGGSHRGCLRQLNRSLWADRRGASAIVLALSLSTILGAAGLAVDAGVWYNDKRTLQGIADLAAWTGGQTYATELQANTATATALTDGQNAAQALAAANGVRNGVNGVTVTINAPAASGPNAGVAGTFEVIVQKSESLFFSSQYLHSVTVTGRAVSGYQVSTTGSGSPGCVLALNTLTIDGGGKLDTSDTTTSGCGIDVNGTSTTAFTIQNGAQVNVDSLNVVGGTSTVNGSHLTVNDGSAYNIQSGGSATPDPYANITLANAESGANATGCTAAANVVSTGAYSCGYYNNGLAITSSTTLNPGVYVVSGGNFSVGSGAKVSATSGVTIVLTGGANVDIDSGAELDISAPTTGPTAGLIFYGDPASTGTMNFSDGSRVNANGAYYFPASTVNFASGSSATVYCAQLIGYNINFSNGAAYSLNNTNCATYGVQQIGGVTTTTTLKMLE